MIVVLLKTSYHHPSLVCARMWSPASRTDPDQLHSRRILLPFRVVEMCKLDISGFENLCANLEYQCMSAAEEPQMIQVQMHLVCP